MNTKSNNKITETAIISIFGKNVEVTIGDILILSPATFGDPTKLEYSPITHIKNESINDSHLQIRTKKHYFDFQNFYNVVGALRPTDCDIKIELFNLV